MIQTPPHRSDILSLYIKRRNELGKINKFRIVAFNTCYFRRIKDGDYLLLTDVYVFDEEIEVIHLDHLHIKLSKKKKEKVELYPNSYIEMLAHPSVYTRKNGTRDFTFSGVLTDSIKQII